MPTVTARRIVESAALTLFDQTAVRWTPDELLQYVSDGQRETVLLKPTANTLNEVIQLTPGTRQSIPANGLQLVDVIRGMGANGLSPGRAVRQVDRHTLDATRPDWHQDTADLDMMHYMFDDRDPSHFYVTPPQPDPAGHVELVYSATPPEIDGLDDLIALDDAYATALIYFVMSRACAKDSGTADYGKATAYYNMFVSLIQGRKAGQQEVHPEQMAKRAER